MDGKENGSRYLPKVYGLNDRQEFGSSLRLKVSGSNDVYHRVSNQYRGEEENDLEDEELEDDIGETNVGGMTGKNTYDDEEDKEEEDEVTDDEEEEEDVNDGHENGKRFDEKPEDIDNGRPQKKRKFRTLISNYEFAPRVATPSVQKATLSQPSSSGKNSVGDWTEHETFALLDAWGERFLKLGRKSLRSEEWQEVAEKVSQDTTIERTDAQCRNRLDTLKKKYKKENAMLKAGGSGSSKWVFYRRMDILLSSSPQTQQQTGLSCGIDSGEFVFMNPKVYLKRATGLDEMRESPINTDSPSDEDEDDPDGLPPMGNKNKGRRFDSSSVQLLADSIEKFSEIYQKTESNKSKQMAELENMRMDFHRQLETQRREILERAQAEIAKIRQGDDDENDLSAENLSG